MVAWASAATIPPNKPGEVSPRPSESAVRVHPSLHFRSVRGDRASLQSAESRVPPASRRDPARHVPSPTPQLPPHPSRAARARAMRRRLPGGSVSSRRRAGAAGGRRPQGRAGGLLPGRRGRGQVPPAAGAEPPQGAPPVRALGPACRLSPAHSGRTRPAATAEWTAARAPAVP